MMRRAIALAQRGVGAVEPNPTVGCVIVRDGATLGEGYHQKIGGPHAEINALAACTQSTSGATAYVTLEPCCHTNKRTPPCVPALVAAKVARVVVGCVDPNPSVNGQGVAQLRQAGIDVTVPVLEASCRQLIAPFIKNCTQRLPYVTLKWAQTADDKVAGAGGHRLQISGPAATRQVHLLRGRCDAIVVGIGTVLVDDPLLTARATADDDHRMSRDRKGAEFSDPSAAQGDEVPACRTPLRVVLDSELRLPLQSRLAQTAAQVPVVVYSTRAALQRESEKAGVLESLGVRLRALPDHGAAPATQPPLGRVLSDLYEHERVNHVLVEAGPTLARRFLNEGLADRVWIIRSNQAIGEMTAPAAAELPADYAPSGEIKLELDTLTEYLNPHSPVFSIAEASADLALMQT